MAKVTAIPVPQDSLLAGFGKAGAHRDCYARVVANPNGREVSLEEFVTRFYCSAAFRAERVLLGLIGRGASNEDAARLARGEADSFAAWNVIERRENEILLQDFQGSTASWLSVRPAEGGGTELLFGSWVGKPDRGVVRFLMPFHRWYSRVLLGGV